MSELEIIEAALFAAGRAISLEKLTKITGKPKKKPSFRQYRN